MILIVEPTAEDPETAVLGPDIRVTIPGTQLFDEDFLANLPQGPLPTVIGPAFRKQVDGWFFSQFGEGNIVAARIDLAEPVETRYKELTKITMPTGASVSYIYRLNDDSPAFNEPDLGANNVHYKTINYDSDGTAVAEQWEYRYTVEPTVGRVTENAVIAPDNATTVYELIPTCYGCGGPNDANAGAFWSESKSDDNGYYLRRDLGVGTVNTEWEMRTGSDAFIKAYTWDVNGNRTSTKELTAPWSGDEPPPSPSSAQLLRKTVTNYLYPATGISDPNFLGNASPPRYRDQVASTEVYDEEGNVTSRTQFAYQGANLTTQYDWDSTKTNNSPIAPGTPLDSSNAISHAYSYTDRGNLLTATDPNTNITQYNYDSSDVISGCPNGSPTDLYPISMVRGGQTWSYGYDCSSGLRTLVIDPNSLHTTTDADRYARPTAIDEGGLRHTHMTYPNDEDSDLWVVTQKDVSAPDDRRDVSVIHYDQMGRVSSQQQFEVAASDPQTAANQTSNSIITETQYLYDADRNVTMVSNPHRTGSSSTDGWTVTHRNKAGQICEEETFDGASQPSPATNCGPTAGATGRTTYHIYPGQTWNQQRITDPAGATRDLYTDFQGRMTAVVEDPGGLGYITNYLYDARDNLIVVCQGGTISGGACTGTGSTGRTFQYSTLNRLLSATNPETGPNPTTYDYDDAGNLKHRTMGGITRTSVYDSLNRLTSQTYSDGTPSVTYAYDAASGNQPPNCPTADGPVGQLASVSTSVSTNYYFYNKLGQVVCNRQTTASTNFDFAYNVTPQGEWSQMTYPSGKTVSMPLDDAGRTTAVYNGASVSYATGLQYAPQGALTQLKFGNGAYETTAFNGRMHVSDIRLGSSVNGTDLWHLQYGYEAAPSDNGNVWSQTETMPGASGSWTTQYRYDMANRLKIANENPADSSNPACNQASDTGHWCQAYGYDPNGNRTVAGEQPTNVIIDRPTSFNSNNQITNSNFGYDNRGNINLTPWVGTNRRYAFDAENRQISFCTQDASSCPTTAGTGRTLYAYDGEGRRVSKADSTGTTVFAYDARGRLAAEYGGTPPSAGTQYLTADHLGSTRIVTDASKTIVECRDYLPFGDELAPSTGNGRNGIVCYAPDLARQKFTGKERDSESRLDFFEARYMSGAQGRFTSPDPSNLSIDWANPQTWNRYAYVGNNTLRRVDQNGLWWTETHNLAIRESLPGLSPADLKSIMAGSLEADTQVMGVDSQIPAMSGIHHMGSDKVPLATTMAFESWYIQSNQAEARTEQAKWIAEGHTGFSPKALLAFGRAQHPLADSTSPSHENYQKWSGCWGLPTSFWHLDCLSGAVHAFKERPETFEGDRKARTIDLIQSLFLDTFGEDAFRTATKNSEADRKPTHSDCLLNRETGQCVP